MWEKSSAKTDNFRCQFSLPLLFSICFDGTATEAVKIYIYKYEKHNEKERICEGYRPVFVSEGGNRECKGTLENRVEVVH